MPSRPEQHQLEKKSLLALRQQLPDSWVFRRETPDYGIDGSVEIFDDRSSTGFRFYVQVKATSEEGKRKVRLKRDAVEYYRELDLPVLIVLYIEPEDLILARWMHQFDPYYGGWGEKWVTLTLTEEDIWDKQTHRSFADTVEKISKLQRGSVSLPIEWGIFLREEEIGGITSSQIDPCLRRKAAQVESVLRFTTLGQSYFGKLEVDKEEAVASIADRYYCTLHLRGKKIESPEQFAASLLVLVGITLAQADSYGAAAQIFSRFAGDSSVAVEPGLWRRIAESMVRAERIPELVELSEQLHDEEQAPVVIPATVARIIALPSLSEEAKKAYEKFLGRRIRKAKEEGLSPASAHYNYGNFLRSEDCNLKAFKEYRQAAKKDPKYWEKDYFCGEMAGLLFDEGRYRLSAKLYEQALQLGRSEEWRPFYADALAHSGQYAQASEQLQKHIDQADGVKPYWVLKSQILRMIVDELEIDRQRRKRAEARRAANWKDENLLNKSHEDLEVPLHKDALCAAAWFNRGVFHYNEGNDDEALFSFVSAGVAENDSLEAWSNALRVALGNTGSAPILAMVAQAAYNRYGERFIERISHQLGRMNPPDTYRHLLSRMFDHLRNAEPEKSRKLRIWNPDGSHDSLELD
jgi:tetratricopeptide (TPR) repeat protein